MALEWQGKVTANLKPTAQQVWPLVSDFCSLHKWLPTIDTCYKVDGVEGQPGLVRYCAAGGGDGEPLRWSREKLVEIDPIGKSLSYEILDNNVGLKAYKATMKINGGDDDLRSGCQIEWSFVTDPVEGLGYADFLGYFDSGIQGMAKNLDKELGELSTN